MKKINIDGMMCEHCAAHVKEALEGLSAKGVTVSLEGGFAECDTDISDDKIKAAIEEEGYTVTSIEQL